MKILHDIDFMEFVGKQEQQFLDHLSSHRDEIILRVREGVNHFGDTLPWSKTHNDFRLRPGEVTIWAGINGHGKSQVLSHVTASLTKHTTCLVASLEMSIPATGQRLMRQMIGCDNPSTKFINKALDWLDGRLWVYDQLDSVEPERIFGMCIYAMKELGIKHIVIDSLMKCGINPDDFNSQKSFVDRLCWAAKTYGGHIHLVHHVRKGRTEDEIPDKYDVKGAGEIIDLCDNLVIVHRNKEKERAKENNETVKDNIPDATLTVAKQRHGEWEGKILLWFDKSSQQYLPTSYAGREFFDFNEAANVADVA